MLDSVSTKPVGVFSRIFDTRHIGRIPVGKGTTIVLLCYFNCIRSFTDRCLMQRWICLTDSTFAIFWSEWKICSVCCHVCVSLLIWSSLCFSPLLTDPFSSCKDSHWGIYTSRIHWVDRGTKCTQNHHLSCVHSWVRRGTTGKLRPQKHHLCCRTHLDVSVSQR